MRFHRVLSGLVLAMMGGAVAVVTAQQPSPTTSAQKSDQSEVITVTGCVQPETAVLKRNAVAGGIGMGDEYVVTNAALSAGPGADMPKPDVQTTPAETAGSASPTGFGRVYRLTGSQEKELKSAVGQRVEIIGRFKDKEKLKDELGAIGTSGRTGEPTTDNTPEIVIDSFKPTAGTCAPAIK
jgi:hypothetical protein